VLAPANPLLSVPAANNWLKIKSYETYTYADGKLTLSETFTVSSNRVTGRTVYTYGENGYDYVEDVYTIDSSGNAVKKSSHIYTYYIRTLSSGSESKYIKTYDYYYRSSGSENEDLNYNSGYEYIRELEDNSYYTVKYISYTSKNGNKTVGSYTVYDKDWTFPSDAEYGQKAEFTTSVVYNANDDVMYSNVMEYTLIKRVVIQN
jgi:hypothetical protein